MDLDELQSVRDRERQTDKLQQLRESFYADAGEFIQQLREQRARAAERADDPFDAPEVSRLSDEIDTAEQTVEAIYEKRVGKIVKAASFAAADLPAQSEGMTKEEQDLFETLVADIKQSRQRVLAVLAGEDTSSESASPSAATNDADIPGEASGTESGVSAADVMGDAVSSDSTGTESRERNEGERAARSSDTSGDGQAVPDRAPETGPAQSSDVQSTPADDPSGQERSGPASDATDVGSQSGDDSSGDTPTGTTDADRQVDRKTVRITDDVGAIFGVDEREYDLSEDDVVTLPSANADPLVERDAAERLD